MKKILLDSSLFDGNLECANKTFNRIKKGKIGEALRNKEIELCVSESLLLEILVGAFKAEKQAIFDAYVTFIKDVCGNKCFPAISKKLFESAYSEQIEIPSYYLTWGSKEMKLFPRDAHIRSEAKAITGLWNNYQEVEKCITKNTPKRDLSQNLDNILAKLNFDIRVSYPEEIKPSQFDNYEDCRNAWIECVCFERIVKDIIIGEIRKTHPTEELGKMFENEYRRLRYNFPADKILAVKKTLEKSSNTNETDTPYYRTYYRTLRSALKNFRKKTAGSTRWSEDEINKFTTVIDAADADILLCSDSMRIRNGFFSYNPDHGVLPVIFHEVYGISKKIMGLSDFEEFLLVKRDDPQH